MPIYATNGATIGICTTAQTTEPANAAAYQALTFVDIGEVESLGAFGDTSNEVTFTAIDDARVKKIKGARNAGNLELVCGIDYEDTGQAALITAEGTIHDYAFCITINDAPSGGTPSERYFLAKVMSASEQLDSADNVMKLNATLGINTAVTRVDAAEA